MEIEKSLSRKREEIITAFKIREPVVGKVKKESNINRLKIKRRFEKKVLIPILLKILTKS